MEIITPKDYVGTLMELCQVRRGDFMDMQFMTESRTTLVYEMPLALVSLLHIPSQPCIEAARKKSSCEVHVVMPSNSLLHLQI